MFWKALKRQHTPFDHPRSYEPFAGEDCFSSAASQAFPQFCSAVVVARLDGDAALAFRKKLSHSVMKTHQSASSSAIRAASFAPARAKDDLPL